MRILTQTLALSSLLVAGYCQMDLYEAHHPINKNMVATIKNQSPKWEVHDPDTNPLRNHTRQQLMNLLGTYITPHNKIFKQTQVKDVPQTFDARTQWPDFIHPVRDQQQCGSCWAFGASEALSDRFAIASNGKVNAVLSPEDLVSCDPSDYGCGGGYLLFAWEYLEQTGIVSDKCFPYTAGGGIESPCTSSCVDGSPFTKYKCQEGSIVNPSTVEQMKTELATNGPLEGAFTVYEDFFSYKSGVYYHVSGDIQGGHAIKVIGYGTEDGLDYWLCANSWGTNWGENGFFKIKQGDSGINDSMFGCTPDLTSVAPVGFNCYPLCWNGQRCCQCDIDC